MKENNEIIHINTDADNMNRLHDALRSAAAYSRSKGSSIDMRNSIWHVIGFISDHDEQTAELLRQLLKATKD